MKLYDVVQDKAFDYRYMYQRMWPYVKPYLFRGILAILLAIPVGLLEGVPTLSLKYLFDYVLNGKNPVLAQTLTFWIPFGIIGFALLQGLSKYFNNYLTEWTGQKITIGLKKELFKKLLRFETAFYDKNSSGLVMTRFLNDADGACAGILSNLKELIGTMANSLALVIIIIAMSWKLAIFALVVLGSAFIPVTLIRKYIKYVSQESLKIGSTVYTHFNETFSGNRIITAFNLQYYQFNKFFQQLTNSFNLSMMMIKRVGWLQPIMYFIASLGIAGVLWYGIHLINTNEMTKGSLMAFLGSLLLLYRPVKNLGNVMASMQGSFVTMNRVIDLFDLEPAIKNSPNAIAINSIKNSIKFENVCFEYDKGEPILKGINFEIKIGESLALVGNSGGGKTTTVNLIPRFYDITSGSIKIDGIDVRDIELSSLRQNIAVVFQDNFLFSGTIKDNLLLGKFDATDEEIQQVLKAAYLNEFIASLPEKLNTEIGERGVRLSGGQKQRLAIARAMIKNAPVVILDEATSALDNKSEAIVQMALDRLMENRTVFVIAHRLSTIQNATRIAVINNGEVAEIGFHEELLRNPNGAYSTLYYAQFKDKEQQSDTIDELQEV
jgi:subfamily B ATP-binding cassette protein MsbA